MTIRTEYCVGLIFAYCVVPYYPVIMYATAMGLYGSAQISVIKVYGPRLLALRGFEGVQFLEKTLRNTNNVRVYFNIFSRDFSRMRLAVTW